MGAVVPSGLDVVSDYQARPRGASQAVSSTVTTAATQLLAPGSNVNGAVIRARSLVSVAGSALVLITQTAAPGGWNSGQRYLGATLAAWHSDDPILLPAGYGIWAYVSSGAGNFAAIDYDLL